MKGTLGECPTYRYGQVPGGAAPRGFGKRCQMNIWNDSKSSYSGGKKMFLFYFSIYYNTGKLIFFVHSLKNNHKQHEMEMYIAAATGKHLWGKFCSVMPLRMPREDQREL